MKSVSHIAGFYAVFTALATAVYIGSRALVVWAYKGHLEKPLIMSDFGKISAS
jgi:hypothetical protein